MQKFKNGNYDWIRKISTFVKIDIAKKTLCVNVSGKLLYKKNAEIGKNAKK